MRSLLLHANRFESEIVSASNLPVGIIPEESRSPYKKMENCLVILFCVEEMDSEKQINQLYEEVIRDAQQFGISNLMVVPFVHLSKNIASSTIAKELYQQLLKKFEKTNLVVDYSHFGYSKTLVLEVKGHRCAFKYREFY